MRKLFESCHIGIYKYIVHQNDGKILLSERILIIL